jgi:virulence-associated protein VapD
LSVQLAPWRSCDDVPSGHDLVEMRAIIGLPPPMQISGACMPSRSIWMRRRCSNRNPGESWRDAYAEIRRILVEEGFEWQQGSVYFGNPSRIDAVTCVIAAQRLARELPWFGESVRDVRMLRIEENNDLGPAIE